MLRGFAACRETGISLRHADVFQEVANATQCIVACRAVGKYATGLIRESYSSKGFHNKAKSCNWGPMAGFVLADPRFTKALDIEGQSKTLVAAYLDGATQVPLFISDARMAWLQEQHLFETLSSAKGKRFVRAHSGELSIDFVLQKDEREGLTKGLWEVLYKRTDRMEVVVPLEARFSAPLAPAWPPGKGPKALFQADASKDPMLAAQLKAEAASRLQAESARKDKIAALLAQSKERNEAMAAPPPKLVPVMAVRDPHCTVPANDYRSATTGDYDLFAVWPRIGPAKMMNHLDRRMIGTKELEERINTKKLYSYESEHQGNLTPRISEVKHLLNGGFMREGYTGGNMVHHSDEGGRPFVKSIDLPVFAVVPGETLPYCISTVDDMRIFLRGHDNFEFPMNRGWRRELQ